MIEIAELPGFENETIEKKSIALKPKITWDEHRAITQRYRQTIDRLERRLELYSTIPVDECFMLRLLCLDARPVPPISKVKRGHGYVYLIQSIKDRTCKIGISRSYKNRTKQFTAKLPFKWETVMLLENRDYKSLERVFHELFGDQRLEGEWFQFSVADVIKMWNFKSNDTVDRRFGVFMAENGRTYCNDLYVPQNEGILRPVA